MLDVSASKSSSYDDLVSFRHEQLIRNGKLGNHNSDLTALNFYLSGFYLTMSSNLDEEITDKDRFEGRISQLNEGKQLSESTFASYKSRLRNWQAYAKMLVDRGNIDNETPQQIVKRSISTLIASGKWTKATIAKQCSMTPQAFQRWCQPGTSMMVASAVNQGRAVRLEQFLSLPAGTLLDKLYKNLYDYNRGQSANGDKDRLTGAVNLIRYKPKELPALIADFFIKMKLWKTTKTIVCRFDGDVVERKQGKKSSSWRVRKSDGACPSADLLEEHLKAFYGWMMLPVEESAAKNFILENYIGKQKDLTEDEVAKLVPMFLGKGLKEGDAVIAQFVDPKLQSEFLHWRQIRGRLELDTFISDALALLNEESGFLMQQVEFVWDYPEVDIEKVDKSTSGWVASYKKAAKRWVKKSAKWSARLASLLPDVDNVKERTQERLAPILDQSDLIGVLVNMVMDHAKSRPHFQLEPRSCGSLHLALWVRNQLLLRMLMSNPLRNRNYVEMRYRSDNSGNLYKDENESWRIKFNAEDFKNQKGAARGKYDVPLPSDLKDIVEKYVGGARAILLNGKESDVLFVSCKGLSFKTGTLSSLIFKLTQAHMPRNIVNAGIRTHAFRHIVATAWLKANPEDYLTVAFILHDQLQTVIDNYAHMKAEDGMFRYNQWLLTRTKDLAAYLQGIIAISNI